MSLTQRLFSLEPQYKERVWGGRRLKAADPPVGEAWVAYGESRVRGGEHAGLTVDELAGADEAPGLLVVRVHLHREPVGAVEQLNEQREPAPVSLEHPAAE